MSRCRMSFKSTRLPPRSVSKDYRMKFKSIQDFLNVVSKNAERNSNKYVSFGLPQSSMSRDCRMQLKPHQDILNAMCPQTCSMQFMSLLDFPTPCVRNLQNKISVRPGLPYSRVSESCRLSLDPFRTTSTQCV